MSLCSGFTSDIYKWAVDNGAALHYTCNQCRADRATTPVASYESVTSEKAQQQIDDVRAADVDEVFDRDIVKLN